MIEIILYIIGGIIVLALASALLPYILAGGMIYVYYEWMGDVGGGATRTFQILSLQAALD